MKLASARRSVRIGGYVTLAFAAFQLVALPMLIHRDASGAWILEWPSIAQMAVSLFIGIAAIRESTLAAAVLAAFGVYRVVLVLLAIVRVLDGTAPKQWGPGWLLGAAVTLPFAVFWIRAGLAALSVHRARLSSRVHPAPTP